MTIDHETAGRLLRRLGLRQTAERRATTRAFLEAPGLPAAALAAGIASQGVDVHPRTVYRTLATLRGPIGSRARWEVVGPAWVCWGCGRALASARGDPATALLLARHLVPLDLGGYCPRCQRALDRARSDDAPNLPPGFARAAPPLVSPIGGRASFRLARSTSAKACCASRLAPIAGCWRATTSLPTLPRTPGSDRRPFTICSRMSLPFNRPCARSSGSAGFSMAPKRGCCSRCSARWAGPAWAVTPGEPSTGQTLCGRARPTGLSPPTCARSVRPARMPPTSCHHRAT